MIDILLTVALFSSYVAERTSAYLDLLTVRTRRSNTHKNSPLAPKYLEKEMILKNEQMNQETIDPIKRFEPERPGVYN